MVQLVVLSVDSDLGSVLKELQGRMADWGLEKQDYPEEEEEEVVEIKNCQCLEVGLNLLETVVGGEFFYE